MRPTAIVCADTACGNGSARELGGKGYGLLRLRALGLAVPRFVVVTRGAFEAAVGGCAELERCRALPEGATPDEVRRAAGAAVAAVRAAGCPAWLERELAGALANAGLASGRLAVRSSVIGEDSAAHSFAGVMESRLGVLPAEVPAALVEVWASAFSPRALAYRRRTGLGSEHIVTAAVVQEMATPVASGVLFTREAAPECDGGPPRSVVSAAYGLGEGVVADAADADTFRIAWRGDRVERWVGVKRTRRVVAERGGTRTEAVPAPRRDAPVLDDAQVRRLRDLGVSLERALGGPQDVEWAFDAEGRLLVLQARPLVRGPDRDRRPKDGPRRLWDDANVVESYPGLTRPLTFSFVRDAYARAFSGAAAAFFPVANPLAARPELFGNLIGVLRGRVYYNLLNWYEMFSYFSDSERHRERWDRMVGVTGRDEAALPSRKPLATRLLAALGALRVLLGARRTARAFAARFAAFQERHRDAAEAADPAALALRYRRLERDASGFWYFTLFADLCAVRYHGWLTELATRWAPDLPDLANRLLCGQPDVESVGPVRRLVALAERVRGEPVWRHVLRQPDDGAIWREVGRQPELAELRRALGAYLEDFGDRGVEELKLETSTFRERPERLVALLRRYVDNGLCAGELEQRERATRCQAEREARRRIRGWRGWVFRAVLARAREAIRDRENMRFARSRLFGIVRRLFRRLGEQLAAAGVLAEAEDVFDLTVDEALGWVEATAVTTDLRGLVALRRREYARFAESDLPERFETFGLPQLSLPEGAPPPGCAERRLDGIGCSTGVATGAANVVLDPAEAGVGSGDVLVARSTDPGWVFLMLQAAGIVVERGSPLSHTAIIGRELGIPTVVGVAGATSRIPRGSRLRIDGGSGRVEWA